jgi:2-methylcitrate dehydratase PrpD
MTQQLGGTPSRGAVMSASGVESGHRTAMLDWLACAVGGREARASRAARSLGDGLTDRIAAAGTAGHVLDYDDTYLPGLAHLSAPVAPAALLVADELGASVGDALAAFAAGFEAMARLTAANHPDLRARGWHPTAVGGVVGAATATAALLDLDPERTGHAVRLALLRAGGLRAAFGSDGKSLQVGLASASGATGARLAAAGATASAGVATGDGGFEQAFGARWVELQAAADAAPAVRENWIKAYPCCLQTHAAIEVADEARRAGVRRAGEIVVTVHPVSLHAASLGPDVADGLQAKFSIPYLTAFALLHGPPSMGSFTGVDEDARKLARRLQVRTDPELLESAAVLDVDGRPVARVDAALGSPGRPMDAARLRRKISDLAGDRLDGVLDDLHAPIAGVLDAASLGHAAGARRRR